jgi:site-specific recombinase XerD
VLRVLGKGGHHREVYVTELVGAAVGQYLAERDRAGGAVPARRGRTVAGSSPLIATRDGGRCARADLYTLLRRIAAHAGPELAGVADRVHPHALRHAYVTIALEQDARIHHVQADVGHASIATTQHYDRGLRTRATPRPTWWRPRSPRPNHPSAATIRCLLPDLDRICSADYK